MSRSGLWEPDFTDRDDILAFGRWRAATKSALRGKRGQKFLRELLATLDAMPDKRLIEGELVTPEGEVCAVGSYLRAKSLNPEGIDYYDYDAIADVCGVNPKVIQELEYHNDAYGREWVPVPNVGTHHESMRIDSPEKRWREIRSWVTGHITEEQPHESQG